jgi:hypothetical protein
MPGSIMDKEEAALRREGANLEEHFTRLSSAKTAAEKKEIYWTQETTRLGKKVVHTYHRGGPVEAGPGEAEGGGEGAESPEARGAGAGEAEICPLPGGV